MSESTMKQAATTFDGLDHHVIGYFVRNLNQEDPKLFTEVY